MLPYAVVPPVEITIAAIITVIETVIARAATVEAEANRVTVKQVAEQVAEPLAAVPMSLGQRAAEPVVEQAAPELLAELAVQVREAETTPKAENKLVAEQEERRLAAETRPVAELAVQVRGAEITPKAEIKPVAEQGEQLQAVRPVAEQGIQPLGGVRVAALVGWAKNLAAIRNDRSKNSRDCPPAHPH